VNNPTEIAADLLIIVFFLTGIGLVRSPARAIFGNLLAAAGFLLAAAVTWFRLDLLQPLPLVVVLACGVVLGWWIADKVRMVNVPSMVALQNGAGGLAAVLVGLVDLMRIGTPLSLSLPSISGLATLVLGGMTVSGSLVACLKLANRLPKHFEDFPGSRKWAIVAGVTSIAVLLVPETWFSPGVRLTGLALLSATWSLLIFARVGGADMPVLISFLNATSGLAAGFCGIVIGNRLLAAGGAAVAASGTVLTMAMCSAMNRSLASVFRGISPGPAGPREVSIVDPATTSVKDSPAEVTAALRTSDCSATPTPGDSFEQAVEACRNAKTVVIIPGYGMAMSQSQFEVVELGRLLGQSGKDVRYAVHPVAGRMPGHMHVLLAEAEVPFDQLNDLAEGNRRLEGADLAIVVGASDVVNPAAASLPDTPISGMPILKAHMAKAVLVCNLNDSPGYSGVANQLYSLPGTLLLWGDAREVLRKVIDLYSAEK